MEMFDTLFHFKIKYIQTNKLMFKVTYLQSFNANALNGQMNNDLIIYTILINLGFLKMKLKIFRFSKNKDAKILNLTKING